MLYDRRLHPRARDTVTIAARWLFADQLGDHFLDGVDDDRPVILIESLSSLRRRAYHRAKVQLILSALRHRADELGDRAVYVTAPTFREGFAEAIERIGISADQVAVSDPTSYGARRLVRELGIQIGPARGFVTPEEQFAEWVDGRKRLVMEDFYRSVRRRTGILMEGDEPVGGRWNLDADNRQPPPRGVPDLGLPDPLWPVEDDIDAKVRADLDRWEQQGLVRLIGQDGPRLFAATRSEAAAVLCDFVAHRLSDFGPYEDAAMTEDWVMAHSLLSAPMNLGLLDPMTAIDAVQEAYRTGDVGLASAEGFIRQVMGWRDYVWHLYWHLGEDYVSTSNALQAQVDLPEWWVEMRAGDVTAKCLSTTLSEIHARGWTHHIPRLMILGNWALQQGYRPDQVTEWFTSVFIDAYPWVMAANVIGMALYADGGVMATKPYAAGGAYIKRMTNYCKGCEYRPTERVGERGCPFTAGYWAFFDRNHERLVGNHRLAQPLRGLERLSDREQVVSEVAARGTSAP